MEAARGVGLLPAEVGPQSLPSRSLQGRVTGVPTPPLVVVLLAVMLVTGVVVVTAIPPVAGHRRPQVQNHVEPLPGRGPRLACHGS